jgi:hypothetical protein
MIRLLGLVALFALLVFAAGIFRGWFVVQLHDTADQRDIHVTINKNAIQRDKAAFHPQQPPGSSSEMQKNELPQ